MRLFHLLLAAVLCMGPLLASAASPSGPQDSPPAVPADTARKHLVYFRDKAGSPYSTSQPLAYLSARAVQRRQRQNIAVLPRDLPVTPAYVQQVRAVAGVRLWYTSRWFNAAVVSCNSSTLAQLRALPCVQTIKTVNRSLPATRKRAGTEQEPAEQKRGTRAEYGPAYTQARMIGAVEMHDAGFRGEGMHIAVFDAGFPGVNTAAPFAALREENRLASVFNFVAKSRQVYQNSNHGTNSLATIAADLPGQYIGTAPKATYHLLVTEDVASEHPAEEVNWLIAAEYADSVGVDIISSSLGYNTFDYPFIDYTYNDLNGRTALSTRAATVAARVGMLVVNSAGNEGNRTWRYVTAPADADSILTVGAVDSLLNRAGFSSVGPTADGRIKPNLSAMGQQTAIVTPNGSVTRGNGTSFSCPVLAGMAAGFWQANPTLTAQQVLRLLERSGSRATMPNDEVGYGIPHFVRAHTLANPDTLLAATPASPCSEVSIYPNPSKDNELFLQVAGIFCNKPLHIRIFDARGGLVSEQQLAATTASEIRLQPLHLIKGVYTCSVTAGQEQRTVRFVKL